MLFSRHQHLVTGNGTVRWIIAGLSSRKAEFDPRVVHVFDTVVWGEGFPRASSTGNASNLSSRQGRCKKIIMLTVVLFLPLPFAT